MKDGFLEEVDLVWRLEEIIVLWAGFPGYHRPNFPKLLG